MNLIGRIKSRKANISVLGLGYMGLPISCLLADSGFNVTGFDINKDWVDELNGGSCPFHESGLDVLLKNVLHHKKFIAANVLKKADIYIIAVPTPLKGNKADLSYLLAAINNLSEVLDDGALVIVESTIPPGTCRNKVMKILDKSKKRYFLVHCPERAIPGNTLFELVNNDRITGGLDDNSVLLGKCVYESFVKGKIFTTDLETAETAKLLENTFRDINIAIANNLFLILKRNGIDHINAIRLANLHPRVNILSPGPGVGGHCIPVDPWFLVQDDNSQLFDLIKESRRVNNEMPLYVVKEIEKKVKGIKNPIVTILGVAYKKNVDDTRESPALVIIEKCIENGWDIKVHDPVVKEFKYQLLNFDEAVKGSDLLVIVTPHDFYKRKDFSKNNLLDIFGFLN